jgi:hypothetical protein
METAVMPEPSAVHELALGIQRAMLFAGNDRLRA